MLRALAVLLYLFVANGDPAPPAQSLNNKVMVGYQGWFVSGSDGAGMTWNHWSTTGKAPAPSPSPTNTGLAFDLWPDTAEYDSSALYDTDLYYANGTRARLFSAYNAPTVQLHLQWMQQYGIDGLFLQRFVSELTNPTTLNDRNQVLFNVRTYAEKYQRTFVVMYDISGADPNTFNTTILNDWAWITSQGILNSPYYQYHNNRAVVCIWGMGFSGRDFDVTTSENLIHSLRNLNTVPMGGVPYYWRTGDHDSDPGWMPVYQSFEILQPWAVGRYGDDTDFDSCLQNVAIPDVQYIQSNNLSIDYNPVIFPGFSWANLQNTPDDYNQIPRDGGSFFCYQAQGVLNSLKPLFVYVAMFDEVNEGTAVFKAASNQADTPVGAKFLYLNVDGDNLPTDHYLTLTGSINKALKSGDGSGVCNAYLKKH